MPRGVTTSLDYIVRRNRIRAASNATVIHGGQAGRELAEAAKSALTVKSAMAELDGEMRVKFVLGLHPVDQSGRYAIP